MGRWDDEGGGRSGRRAIGELRFREDGFTPEKQKRFLKALRKTGCVADAARKARVSTTTVARARKNFADFDARCVAARKMALPALEEIAWQRATVGAPAKIIRKGRLFEVRVKPSDTMLRLLLAGAAPEKYGRYAGLPATGKAAAAAGGSGAAGGAPRKRMSFDEAIEKLDKALEAQRRLAVEQEGYTLGPEGELLPPGWRMVREEELARLGWSAPGPEGGSGEADKEDGSGAER